MKIWVHLDRKFNILVRVRTRLLTQDVSIEKLQTNVPAFGRIVFPALSGL